MIYVRIADEVFSLNCRFKYTEQLCSDYTVGAYPDAVNITVSDSEIARENVNGEWRDDYLESLAILRKIADYLLTKDTLLFHASVVAVNGCAYAFTAVSGTGKSTHTRLWRTLLGDSAVMVNDDKPFVRISDGKAIAYGTPWDGKHRLSNNIAVPIKGICLLHRGEVNSVLPVEKSASYPMLLQQCYRPERASLVPAWLRLVDKLADSASLYTMNCNTDISAAALAYETMRKDQT